MLSTEAAFQEPPKFKELPVETVGLAAGDVDVEARTPVAGGGVAGQGEGTCVAVAQQWAPEARRLPGVQAMF